MTILPALLTAGALFLFATPSIAADQKARPEPPAVDCAMVRQVVAERGRIGAVRLAREHGASWAQIAKAQRCLL